MVIYFFCFASDNLFWTVHRDERINYYSVWIREKQSGTVKNVEHSKNDYHERSKQVPKDWHSGDYDAKWQENWGASQTETEML